MANISDIIEKFILDALKEDRSIQISRNELANYFDCAPSQINYVLATRFSLDRGYEIFSQRGGGGYIKLSKIVYTDKQAQISDIINNKLCKPIDYVSARKMVDTLINIGFLKEDEANITLSAIKPKALSCPIDFECMLRSQILKSIIIGVLQQNNQGGKQNV